MGGHLYAGSYCSFVGDINLGADAEQAMAAIGKGPRGVPRLLADIARYFGLPVSAGTLERWLRLWAAVLLCDRLVDDTRPPFKKEAFELFERLLRGKVSADEILLDWVTETNVRPMVALMHASLAETSVTVEIPELGIQIAKTARAKSATPSLFWYLITLIEENSMSGRLMALAMSDEERSHASYPLFVRWCQLIVVSASLLDAWKDLSDDWTKRLTQVQPRPLKRLAILAVWLVYSMQFTRDLGAVRVTLWSMWRNFFEVRRLPTQNKLQRLLCTIISSIIEAIRSEVRGETDQLGSGQALRA